MTPLARIFAALASVAMVCGTIGVAHNANRADDSCEVAP